MKRLYFSRFKTLILMMLIVTTMSFSYNTQKANAAVQLYVVVGGVLITGAAVTALVGYTLQSGGVKLKSSDVSSQYGMAYVADKLIRGGQAAHYLSVQLDSANNKFLTWTSDGFNWFKDTFKDMLSNGVTVSGTGIASGSFTYSSLKNADKNVSFGSPILVSTGQYISATYTFSDGSKRTAFGGGSSSTGYYYLSVYGNYGEISARLFDGDKSIICNVGGLSADITAVAVDVSIAGKDSFVVQLSPEISQFSTQKSETAVQEVVEVTDPSTGEKKNENRPKIGVPIIPGKDTTTNPDGTTQIVEVPNPSNPPVIDGESDWDSTSAPITINYPKPNDDPKTDPTTQPTDNPKTDTDTTVPKGDIPKLDFTPLMVATRKFPFCIPWDLWDSYKIFEGNSEPFKYEFKQVDVNFGFIGCGSVTVVPNFVLSFEDYPQVDTAVKVFKFIELILFIVFLIVKTRTLIRG